MVPKARRKMLITALLACKIVSHSSGNLGYAFLTIASTASPSNRRRFRLDRRRVPSTQQQLAFVSQHVFWHTAFQSPIIEAHAWNSPRLSVSLGVGRERRVSSPDLRCRQQKHKSPKKNQDYTQEQIHLVEKEASARRKRLDQMEQRFRKAARREDRISFLETKLAKEQEASTSTSALLLPRDRITDAERSELEGLLRARENFEEQYDSKDFSEEHLNFKTLHNDVFARLVTWCENERDASGDGSAPVPAPAKVFFLDGPDGGTASFLINQATFAPSQCFVANRHESTCSALRRSGGGILPEENVVDATASEALNRASVDAKRGSFASLDFIGYYFDGCSGYAPHIVNMMSAALLVLDDDNNNGANSCDNRRWNNHPIAVGYSLLGGTRHLVEKELEVSRALTLIARSRGMKVIHPLEDPSTFGLPANVSKLGGNGGSTFTTWLILKPE